MKSTNAFIDRTQLNLTRERLPGYPQQVPGHLLISDILAAPNRPDIDLMVSQYGTHQLRSILNHLVEKGRISPAARKQSELMLQEHDNQPDLFRTL